MMRRFQDELDRDSRSDIQSGAKVSKVRIWSNRNKNSMVDHNQMNLSCILSDEKSEEDIGDLSTQVRQYFKKFQELNRSLK